MRNTPPSVPVFHPSPDIDTLVAATTAFLASEAARDAIDRDAYWPKWHGPWWQVLLLHEMGQPQAIPAGVAERLGESVHRKCLHTFPVGGEPPGVDGYRGIQCFCALGSLYQMMAVCGVDVPRRFPWMRAWFVDYQMADGDWNCDETAYQRASPRSSIQSTLPMLEALLHHGGDLSDAESACLDRGADYLLSRRLHLSLSKGAAMDPAFVEPVFPRYYDYDVLRGLGFVVAWAEQRGRSLRRDDLLPALSAVAARCDAAGSVRVTRDALSSETTLAWVDGTWLRGQPSGTFPLLQAVNRPGAPSPWLTRQWHAVQSGLTRLEAAGRLT